MNSRSSVAVVIVSYNVRNLLLECLQSVIKNNPIEIVVVDNFSDDDSVDSVKQYFPSVKLLPLTTNSGFATAVNMGVAATSAQNILLLNPDTRLSDGALDAMGNSFNQHADAWALGFRQVDKAGHFQLSTGQKPSIPAELARRWVQRSLDRGNRWLGKQLDRWLSKSREVAWVAGSSLLVKRWAFDRVGGFDQKFFLYFEDIDFCLRLRKAGGLIYYDPNITVVHHRGRSASTTAQAATRAYRASQAYFWRKHCDVVSSTLVATYARFAS